MFKGIKGYDKGANITLLNTIYRGRHKNEKGVYTDSIDIVYKDLDTGEKHVHHIDEPEYRYYMANDNVPCSYNRLFIYKKYVHPVDCKYKDLLKSIATETNNLEFFYDNIRSGNFRLNEKLFTIPTIFNADMDINNYIRYEFNKMYKNEAFSPNKLYFDIEVDGIDQKGVFPELGECPVNAVTLLNEENRCVYTLLLENKNNPLIEEFKNSKGLIAELKEFVRENLGGYKREIIMGLDNYEYKIAFYEKEIELIVTIFNIINTLKPDYAVAWNMAFDIPYLIERLKVLGYNPASVICHKDFDNKVAEYIVDKNQDTFEKRCDYAMISSYTVYLDQLLTYAGIRKGQRKTSMKLDNVGYNVAKVRKLNYHHITTDIAKLPYLDYKVFVFYNIMDVVVQKCIESSVNDLDFILSKSLSSLTSYDKIHRETTYLVNIATTKFDEMGYVIGCNCNKNNIKEKFPGAFVADPLNVSDKPKMRINGNVVNLINNGNDFDYAALYPSIIDENNMAPNTMIGKIQIDNQIDYKENRFNNDYFDRSVYLIEDYTCRDELNFCNRYLNLGSYEDVYNDIIEYYTKIKSIIPDIVKKNEYTDKQLMCVRVNKDLKVRMVSRDKNLIKERK